MATRKDNKGRNLHTGEQQRKDGRYLYRYTDLSGKRQTVYEKTLPLLREKEKQIQKDLDNGLLLDSSIKKITLNELFEKYISTKDLAESTRVNYEKIWENLVKEDIGMYKAIVIRKSHVKAFYSKLSKAGYSHNTIRFIHTLIIPVLELAVEDDILLKNVAKNALSSEYGEEPKQKVILTQKQQDQLMAFLGKNNVYSVYVPMITVFLELGLRCGELIGLRWSDLYMSERTLTIDHQLIYKNYGDGCKFHISSPKTKAGIRDIPLTNKVANAFVRQKEINFMLGRKSNVEIDGYTDFIFITKNNRPFMPSAINNILYNIVDAYNKEEFAQAKKEHRKAELLPKISAHCLRHTACTNMARKGMNMKVLQYLMGHSDSSITIDVYNHLNNEVDVRNEVLKCDAV